MPLYIYECCACEIEIEERCERDRAPLLVECPICHELCRRALTAALVKHAAPQEVAPRYGDVTAAFHGQTCSCCAPRRRT
jgi:hypothetical protein